MTGLREMPRTLPRIIVTGLREIPRTLPRIIVTGLFRISLPVRLGPRQGARTIEVMIEGVEAEAEAEEMLLVAEELPRQALVVEMGKKRTSLVDRRSTDGSIALYAYVYTPPDTKP